VYMWARMHGVQMHVDLVHMCACDACAMYRGCIQYVCGVYAMGVCGCGQHQMEETL
jgi:hypothetical protein